jgi:hypothetical protein
MILENVFSLQDPECIFCKNSVKYVDNKGLSPEITKYYCLQCKEIFEIYNNCFMFTISNFDTPLEVHLYFVLQKFCILKGNEVFPNFINWLPMFNFDFQNKTTLYNKLKTYLTFS